jgi:hypothetical protein
MPTSPRSDGPAWPGGRVHPSRGARAVALVSSIAATVGVTVALARADDAAEGDTTIAVGEQPTSVPSTTTTARSSPASSVPAPPTTAAPTPTTGSASLRMFVGPPARTRWGSVQVRVTIDDGKIVAVTELQAPNDNSKSRAITSSSRPILEAEAVAAQSADISAVSGATYTSESYKVSLQGALDEAARAG